MQVEEQWTLRGGAKAGVILLALAVVLSASGGETITGQDDWGSMLSGDKEQTSSHTGVVGMTGEDMEAYQEEEEAEVDDEQPEDFISNRRRFVVREFMFNADWNTDPTALPNFVYQFKRLTGMKALALQPRKPLTFSDAEITDWPFIYMTAHMAFSFQGEDDVKNIRNYLERGGFIYADDCLFGFPFGQAFPGEFRRVLPEADFKPLDPKSPVYGNILKQKFSWGEVNEAGLPKSQFRPNFWHYIEIGGHMAVLYTPQDIGCAWEISGPPTPSNPWGEGMHNIDYVPYTREYAHKLGVNIVLWNMLH